MKKAREFELSWDMGFASKVWNVDGPVSDKDREKVRVREVLNDGLCECPKFNSLHLYGNGCDQIFWKTMCEELAAALESAEELLGEKSQALTKYKKAIE